MPRHPYDCLVWLPALHGPSPLVPHFPPCARKLLPDATAPVLGPEDPGFGALPLRRGIPSLRERVLEQHQRSCPRRLLPGVSQVTVGDVGGITEKLRGLGRSFSSLVSALVLAGSTATRAQMQPKRELNKLRELSGKLS